MDSFFDLENIPDGEAAAESVFSGFESYEALESDVAETTGSVKTDTVNLSSA
jgi:hypothetical protein